MVECNKINKYIDLSQTKYITKIIIIFNMYDFKFISILLKVRLKLIKDMSLIDLKDVKIIIDVPYSIALEYLMHAMTHTRPNIVFFINKVAKYKANLSQAHWFAIKCMMRYHKDILNYRTIYQSEQSSIDY